jgi:hypothetical protein
MMEVKHIGILKLKIIIRNKKFWEEVMSRWEIGTYLSCAGYRSCNVAYI